MYDDEPELEREAGPCLRCPQCAGVLQDPHPASRRDGWEGWCPTHGVVAGVDGDRATILSRRGTVELLRGDAAEWHLTNDELEARDAG